MEKEINNEIKGSVFHKLMQARVALQGMELKKSGQNKFAGYSYFELGDFLPAVQKLFLFYGLCDVISFERDGEGKINAEMRIYDVVSGDVIVFRSPFGSAELKGCHEVQNIGAVETYQRRYLYTTALAISEHDAIDADTGKNGNDVKKKPVVNSDDTILPTLQAAALEGMEALLAAHKAMKGKQGFAEVWTANSQSLKTAAQAADEDAK